MLFHEALEQLKSGESMRRSSWPESEGYLQLLPGMKHVWKIMLQPNPNAGNFIFSVEDFVSSDWVKFESLEHDAANTESLETKTEAA